jgi:hypothetical protein
MLTRVSGYHVDYDAPILAEAAVTVAGREVTP